MKIQNVYLEELNPLTGTQLLNAGLPWTNPMKLQIGSDEHILDTTINRGLMMLLNNDYYLDMKTSLISKEISALVHNNNVIVSALVNHMNDNSMHQTSTQSTTIKNEYYTTVVVRRWLEGLQRR